MPVCLPLEAIPGVNCTTMSQVDRDASTSLEHLSLVMVNEPGLVPPRIAVPNVTGTVLGFLIAIVLDLPSAAAAAVPSPLDFAKLSATAVPFPFKVTVGLVPL